MSLESTLQGLAAEIGKNRNPTGSVAAPAKLRHRTGAIDAYTAGGLTASVQIGGDVVDAPFLATYSPAVGDTVSVLINNGSPLILGPVNKAPGPSNVARMSVFATFAAAALTGTHTRIHAWDGTADESGTSIQLNSPDDGGLYLFTKGMYAITTSLKVDGLLAAAGTFSIVVLTGATEFPNVGVCSARGGDAAIDEWAASSSQTYYSPGTGFSGGIFVDLDYTAIDPSIVSVSVAVDVALVSA